MNNAAQSLDTSPDLRVGRRIHCILYGGKNGTITSVEGTPGLGNSRRIHGVANLVAGPEAYVTIVWDNGGVSVRVPECICTGVQWRFLDEPDWDQEQINDALVFAQEKDREAKEAKAAAERDFVAKVQDLRNSEEYADLEQSCREGRTDKTKLAAKNIRKVLKKAHPGVKFSVRKESYSSLWITWPRSDESESLNQQSILKLVGKFETGYYDTQQDLSRDSESPFNIVFGGVNHITAQVRFD